MQKKKNENSSSQTSSPAALSSTNEPLIYPETYLKLKRQQEEKARLESSTNSSNPTSNHLSNHTYSSNQTNHHQSNPNANQPRSPTSSSYPAAAANKFNQSFESTNLDEDQSTYLNQSQRSSFVSFDDTVINTSPRFIQDSSPYWYRPTISREEAIKVLLNKPPGCFIVRDSESFKGAFGLAIRVSAQIAEQQKKSYGEGQTDLVRHFLIEPTSRGVRIRGCPNEPVFGSLSALIYQHTTTQLALPCKLILPDVEPIQTLSIREPKLANQLQHQQLMISGAACECSTFIFVI